MLISGFQELRAEIEKGFYSYFDQTNECLEISKIIEKAEFRLDVYSWEKFEAESGEEKFRKIDSFEELKIFVNSNSPKSAAILIRKTAHLSVGENELNKLIELFYNSGKTKYILLKENASGYHVINYVRHK